LRPKLDHNYAEPDSDNVNLEEDSEEDSDEMQQGYLCTSADPRRIGEGGDQTIILNPRELRKVITPQQNAKDQTIWMTTAQTGFPLERDEDEDTNRKDTQMGRITERYLHPVISTFIANWETDLTSSGKQLSPLDQPVIDLENEWSQKYACNGNLGSPDRTLTITCILESRPTSTNVKPPVSNHGL
jgi:hypothetical protein